MSQSPPTNPDHRNSAAAKVTPAVLTPEQLSEIARAKQRGVKLQRAVRVATTDAWITAIFAVGAILTSCGGIDQLAIGIALAWVAFTSFRGVAGLKRFDRSAPGRLAFNQVFLASAIILYAAYELWLVSTGKSALLQALAGNTSYGDLGDMGQTADNLRGLVVWALKLTYVLLIFGTIVGQGLTALYYRSRRQILDAYLEQTPQWVVDLQKAQLG
jgi:hypothetical protein